MKNIFDAEVARDFTARILRLSADAAPQWGKMNAYQMTKHYSEIIRSSFGERQDKRPVISYLIGKILLKSIVKNDKPPGKNNPTHPAFVVKETGNFTAQQQVLLSLVNQYPVKNEATFNGRVHPFFGKMNAEEYGILDYKHLDHHLRQFGV